MKKSTLLLSFMIIFTLSVSAQTIPNPGFETWTSDSVAEGWVSQKLISTDGFSQTYSCASKSEIAHSGSYSVKITPVNFGNLVNLYGVFQMGEIIIDFENMSFNCIGGIPCTTVPAEFRSWINYSPDGIDSLMKMQAIFTKWNETTQDRDTIAFGEITHGSTDSAFVELVMPIDRKSTEAPDTMNIIYYSSTTLLNLGDAASLQKTSLLIDDITISSVSVEENILMNVSVYPNPANSNICVESEINSEVMIFNSFGKVVYSKINTAAKTYINTENFATGVYFIRVSKDGKDITKAVSIGR